MELAAPVRWWQRTVPRRALSWAANVGAAALVVALLAHAPFIFRRAPGQYVACPDSPILSPPLRGALLCEIHWEQFLVRLALILALWALAQFIARRLAP